MGKREIEIEIQKKKEEYNNIEVDGRVVLKKLFDETKYKNIVVDKNYILSNIGSYFFRKSFYYLTPQIELYGKHNVTNGFISGSLIYFENVLSGTLVIYDKYNEKNYIIRGNGVMQRNIEAIFKLMDNGVSIIIEGSNRNVILDDVETSFLKDYVSGLNLLIEHKAREIEIEVQCLNMELSDEIDREASFLESTVDELEKYKNDIISQYDSSGNGVIDEIEYDVLGELIKNNQSVLIEKDKSKVHNFIKLVSYLRGKKYVIKHIYDLLQRYDVKKELDNNTILRRLAIDNSVISLDDLMGSIELIRECLRINLREAADICYKIKNESTSNEDFVNKVKNLIYKGSIDLKNLGEMLEEEINIYKTLVFHSINMVVSLKNEELITFYEIYEMFDKLGVFNSNWENDISNKLSNVETGIANLRQSIKNMNDEIVSELISLNYIVDSSISSLEANVNYELQGIKSSVNFNNLLTSVNTYQLSKLNSKTSKLLNGR